jgi:DNA-binding CsgD family transcriptional regulator
MRALLNDEPPSVFEETPQQHQQRVHPDLAATHREREILERQLGLKMLGEISS